MHVKDQWFSKVVCATRAGGSTFTRDSSLEGHCETAIWNIEKISLSYIETLSPCDPDAFISGPQPPIGCGIKRFRRLLTLNTWVLTMCSSLEYITRIETRNFISTYSFQNEPTKYEEPYVVTSVAAWCATVFSIHFLLLLVIIKCFSISKKKLLLLNMYHLQLTRHLDIQCSMLLAPHSCLATVVRIQYHHKNNCSCEWATSFTTWFSLWDILWEVELSFKHFFLE